MSRAEEFSCGPSTDPGMFQVSVGRIAFNLEMTEAIELRATLGKWLIHEINNREQAEVSANAIDRELYGPVGP